jgi:hypothetical protein
MGYKNQNGQALIEFVFLGLLFVTLLLVIESMIQQKNKSYNQRKLSKEVFNEFKYRTKNENY